MGGVARGGSDARKGVARGDGWGGSGMREQAGPWETGSSVFMGDDSTQVAGQASSTS
jgi:hypothetical protein